MNFNNLQLLQKKLQIINCRMLSLSAIQQVYLLVAFGLFLQYSLNTLVYYQFIPDLFGYSLNGIAKNSAYMIPGILAIMASLFYSGGEGVRKLLRPYKVLPLNPFWWFFSLGIILLILWLSLHLNDFLYQRELSSYSLDYPSWQNIKTNAPLFIQVALSDELFWIGFIYPRLLATGYSPLKASLLIGVFWGIEYVPFIYTEFFVAQGLSLSSLALGWFALSPIYIWLYHRTGSAVIIVFFNVCMQFSFSVLPTLPLVVGDNSVIAMGNLLTLLVGIFVWRYFPGSNSADK